MMCQDLKNTGQSTPNDRHNIKAIEHKKISYRDIEIKEEVLLLVDSNGAKVDESRLSRDVACKKVFTPTWNHVKDMLQALNGKCLKNIKQIWVHVATNDTSTNESLKIIQCIAESLGNMKSSFPEAEISVSKVIPQKSLKMYRIHKQFLGSLLQTELYDLCQI